MPVASYTLKLALVAFTALSTPLAVAQAADDASQGNPAAVQTFVGRPTYDGLNHPGAVLPSSSIGQGEPKPLNSLPSGAANGTPAMERHEVLQSYRSGTEKPQK